MLEDFIAEGEEVRNEVFDFGSGQRIEAAE